MGHTKGPWRYAETWRQPVGHGPHETNAEGNIFWGYSISGSNEHGGHILPTLGAVHNFPENMLANARLIAAAPDLLKSLEQMIADFGDSAGDDSEAKQVLADACAAVAKARPVEDET